MDLTFDKHLAGSYKNQSQIARVLTEDWVSKQAFCPNCGANNVERYKNNKPVADFYCKLCKEDYELKSKSKKLEERIVDGAYETMIIRLQSSTNPNLFLLSHDSSKVTNFLVVPKHFFTPKIIEKRTPLSPAARRAGWVGCNINVKFIPRDGKIFFVFDSEIQPRDKVIEAWHKSLFLRDQGDLASKAWLLDIMKCIDQIDRQSFRLSDVYLFEEELRRKHSNNMSVKAKIRQQLQIMRDKGYLEFTSRGNYRKV